MNSNSQVIADLVKALEAGQYNMAPSNLTQGSALQIEDMSPVMEVVTFDDEHIILQKMVKVDPCKSILAQFNRQLSYGQFGASATFEGAVGVEQTSDYVRIVVPMCFYSHVRKVSLQATLVATADGMKADDRAAKDAAKSIAGDVEFDLFRGKADFSTTGLFTGDPMSIPTLPNMLGLDPQVRQSDNQRNAQDQMFAAYGSSRSVVIAGGNSVVSTLVQDNIEDAAVRSALSFGNADKLCVDPLVLSAYNKITFGKERIMLAGTPQDATAGQLKKQWVSTGTVEVVASQFLRGRYAPDQARATSPAAPVVPTATPTGTDGALAVGYYNYYVTAVSELGESLPSPTATIQVTATTQHVPLVITVPSGLVRYFNVYRTAASSASAGPGVATAAFIGRVANSGASTVTFTDLGNKRPGFVTGFLVQGDTMAMKELAPYSRKKLAETDLSMTEAHFRFCTLGVLQPRKNVLIDNLTGNVSGF